MRANLISLSLVALTAATLAAGQPGAVKEGFNDDRVPPTYPELGFDGWRNNAGDSDKDNAVQTQLGSIDGYRNHAGESEKENTVQAQLG